MEVKTHPEYSTRYPLLLTNCMRRPLNYTQTTSQLFTVMTLESITVSPGVSGIDALLSLLMPLTS